jgi:predicted nucleic-acid-binding Zn-ribbon protein
MSSMTSDTTCEKCGSTNAYHEMIQDSEVGHIEGCFSCGWYDVYRADAYTSEVLEDFEGYGHPYAQEDINEGRREEKKDE